MATIPFYVRQDTRKSGSGMWYGKAYIVEKKDLDFIAGRIQQNTTFKKADVMAYLTELIDVMKESLLGGYKVQLGNIGYFSLGIISRGALTEKKYNLAEHLKGVKVNFQTVNQISGGVTTRGAIDTNVRFIQIENPYKKVEPPTP